MNINQVSFKGTFSLKQEDLTHKKFVKVADKEDELCLSFEASGASDPNKLFVHAPDEVDVDLMRIFNKLKIPFVRISEAESLNHNNIRNRIILNQSTMYENPKLVEVDTLKLDAELRKEKDSYVGRNAINGSYLKYQRAINFLKTNQKIRSTVLYLRKDSNGNIETRIYDGRHRFAVMRDMGMTTIPVTIDEESLKLAREVGFIKSEL